MTQPQTTIDIALEGIKNAKPEREAFYTMLRDVVYQLDDDNMREKFDAALMRFRNVNEN